MKGLAAYMYNLASTLLGFAHDAKSLALVLGKDLHRLRIQTEVDHARLYQYKDMNQEHRTVWRSIRNVVKLSQKREV